jgi:hypothetical protein
VIAGAVVLVGISGATADVGAEVAGVDVPLAFVAVMVSSSVEPMSALVGV